ncbi:hypothetical protein [Nonomuraea fuscirosea]|uniref:hypothetical protein n=1 Tax=Nonomuraea fuscirosea TaxID=1291556 RepID=UPI0033F6DBC8
MTTETTASPMFSAAWRASVMTGVLPSWMTRGFRTSPGWPVEMSPLAHFATLPLGQMTTRQAGHFRG